MSDLAAEGDRPPWADRTLCYWHGVKYDAMPDVCICDHLDEIEVYESRTGPRCKCCFGKDSR